MINKVILLGHVGKDAEKKEFSNGNCIVSFSLATTEKGYTSKNGTEIPDRTEWHNIVVIGNLTKVGDYIKKGSQLYVEGKINTRNYDDKNGVKRYVTEIFASEIKLLGKKEQNQDSNSNTAADSYVSGSPYAEPPKQEPVIEDSLPF